MGSCPDTDIDPKNLTTQNKEPFRINTERIRRSPPGPLVAKKKKAWTSLACFYFFVWLLTKGLKVLQPQRPAEKNIGMHCCSRNSFTYILCQLSACNCSTVGAVNSQCNNMTGLCSCHSHVTGKLCDRCEQNSFNYTSSGCTPCDCDIEGSTDLQCDLVSIHSLFFIR